MFAVEMHNISKRFGLVAANDSVDFRVRAGDVHALVGENGAGKSTLMNILYGLHRPDSGEISVDGHRVKLESPARAIALGIGMVHQHFMLVGPLSVTENVILGRVPGRTCGFLDTDRARREIEELAALYRLRIDPGVSVHALPVGIQQRVEILKILFRQARILIFDEPTAVLSPQEVDEFFQTLRELRNQGKTVILITHKLGEVMAVSDSVTVMRRGRVVGTMEAKSTTSTELARLMVGRELGIPVTKEIQLDEAEPRLVLDGVTVLNDRKLAAVRDVSFGIAKGEILGIAGVAGSGQTELAQVIAGLRPPTAGSICIDGKPTTQRERLLCVAHIPEDRQRWGLVLDFTVGENLLLGRHREPQFLRGMFLQRHITGDYAGRLIQEFDIRPPRDDVLVRGLSGGNQQKVVIAREVSKQAEVIVASHPTRGLDVGASEFVHDVLVKQRNAGKAILLISSDLSELTATADRIAVLYEGRIAAVVDSRNTNERELGLHMTGSLGKSA